MILTTQGNDRGPWVHESMGPWALKKARGPMGLLYGAIPALLFPCVALSSEQDGSNRENSWLSLAEYLNVEGCKP